MPPILNEDDDDGGGGGGDDDDDDNDDDDAYVGQSLPSGMLLGVSSECSRGPLGG